MAGDVKYLKGTSDRYKEYVELGLIKPLSFYYLEDTEELYLGLTKITNEEDFKTAFKIIMGEYQEGEHIPTIKELDTTLTQLASQIAGGDFNMFWGKIK